MQSDCVGIFSDKKINPVVDEAEENYIFAFYQ